MKLKLVIYRLKPFTFKDIRLARLLKPFEDCGLVRDFPVDRASELGLAWTLLHDDNLNAVAASKVRFKDASDLLLHLRNRDDYLAPLFSAYEDETGHIYSANSITQGQDFQSLVHQATSRGLIGPDVKLPTIG